MIVPGILLAVVAAAVTWLDPEPGSALRHAYLLPTLWAALSRGAAGGGSVGLLAGLLQAPIALPAVERLGLTSATMDGLVSLVMPIGVGWVAGRLVDQARDRDARLRAVFDVQRALSGDAPIERSLTLVAERVRASLGADRVGLVLRSSEGELIATGCPGPIRFDPASAGAWAMRSSRPIAVRDVSTDLRFVRPAGSGAAPVRGLVLPLRAGDACLGVLAIERSGELDAATRSTAASIAMLLPLAVENVRLTLRQRAFAGELERKVAGATERLRQLDRAKSEFVSVVAHELRTPLTALQGFSELLVERALPAERASRFIRHIHGEAERLGRIVTELLDLSRIESGRPLDLKRQDVDVEEIVERNIDLFATEHRNHRFERDVPPVLPRLTADRDAVDRMLKNLLSNAVKYSPHGGRVIVAAGPAADHPGMLELSVEDDGVGISAEDLPRVFERYVRIANPETAAARGLGLGLCLVRALAEAHGGRVEAESLPGKGSRFRLLLPASRSDFAQFSE